MPEIKAIHTVHPIVRQLVHDLNMNNPEDSALPEWDYVTVMSKRIISCVSVPRAVLAVIADRRLPPFLKDPNLFEARLLQLQGDLEVFHKEHNDIQSEHRDRHGHTQTGQDHADAYRVIEMYRVYATRVETTIEELLSHIVDMLNEAQDRYVEHATRTGEDKKPGFEPDVIGYYVRMYHGAGSSGRSTRRM